MRAGKADLVLLDLTMPKVTGWQVLTERAAVPERRKIPVIVMTAERGDAVATLLDNGVCALLLKPFSVETLEALVKSCFVEAESAA